MAKLKVQKTYTNPDATTTTVDSYVSPTEINGTNIGGTGGDNSQTVPTIRISYLKLSTDAVDTGYVTAQKGIRQFAVSNTSDANAAVVTLVNRLSTELAAAETGTILVTDATILGANVANIGAGQKTSAYITFTAANVSGVQTPVVGHQIVGTSMTGNVTVTAVNSTGNITVSCATQDIADEQANITTTFNAKRITNKFVWDWSDNKYRYYFGDPYNTGTALSSQPAWQDVTLVKVNNN